MDYVFKFWGLLALAYAIHSGLHAIASALEDRELKVKIEVIHRSENGPSA